MAYTKYPILEDAYEHYQDSLEHEFTFVFKNSDHFTNVMRSIPELVENGFISDLEPDLLTTTSLDIVPPERISFSITAAGIEYVRSGRNR
jgi:hypothetical protein